MLSVQIPLSVILDIRCKIRFNPSGILLAPPWKEPLEVATLTVQYPQLRPATYPPLGLQECLSRFRYLLCFGGVNNLAKSVLKTRPYVDPGIWLQVQNHTSHQLTTLAFKLVLSLDAVPVKRKELDFAYCLLDGLDVTGELITLDAMGCTR